MLTKLLTRVQPLQSEGRLLFHLFAGELAGEAQSLCQNIQANQNFRLGLRLLDTLYFEIQRHRLLAHESFCIAFIASWQY